MEPLEGIGGTIGGDWLNHWRGLAEPLEGIGGTIGGDWRNHWRGLV